MRAIAMAVVLASATTAAAESYKIENNALVVPHPITFATGKADLTPEADNGLDYVKAYLDDKTYVSLLRIEVHADATGSEAFSQKLTEKRAFAVGRALIARGISCKRLIAVGFGSTKPVADNKTIEGRAANRRTMFVNAALKERAIGGMPLDGGGMVAGDLCAK